MILCLLFSLRGFSVELWGFNFTIKGCFSLCQVGDGNGNKRCACSAPYVSRALRLGLVLLVLNYVVYVVLALGCLNSMVAALSRFQWDRFRSLAQ